MSGKKSIAVKTLEPDEIRDLILSFYMSFIEVPGVSRHKR